MHETADDARVSPRVLLIGDDDLGAPVASYARSWGAQVTSLSAPNGTDVAGALSPEIDTVVVVAKDDILALRYALLVEHARPGIRLLVTLFDKTVADEVVRSVPNCTVIGMTDALVPALLGPCISVGLTALYPTDNGYLGVDSTADSLRTVGLPAAHIGVGRRAVDWLRTQLRPMGGDSRALLVGLFGLLTVFVVDTVLGVVVLGQSLVASAWHAAMVLTTVGSGGTGAQLPWWYQQLATTTLLCVLGFTALFTAGLVERVTSSRLTSIVGSRTVPRRGHVIVVGLGQVGVRLCQELQRLGIGVVAVERDRGASTVPVAKSLGIPVVFGRGGDRFLLRKLGLSRARAIVAVSSNAMDNIAVAVAARAIAPDQRIVLRAGGDKDVMSESQSLFRIATACDADELGGAYIAATALGLRPRATFNHANRTYLVHNDGTFHETGACTTLCGMPGADDCPTGSLQPTG